MAMFLFVGCAFSNKNKFFLEDRSGYIFWKCPKEICTIYFKDKNNHEVMLLKDKPIPSIESLDKNLAQLFFSCGSPCNYSFFYDSSIGVSASFEFVVAVNTPLRIVIVARNNELIGYKMFERINKPIFVIKRHWSPAITLYNDIIEANFSDHILSIKYLAGSKYKEKMEVISIPTKFKENKYVVL
jgi:hypothetical protein